MLFLFANINNWKIFFILCALSLFALSACATNNGFEGGTLDEAVYEGVLMAFEDIEDVAAGRLPSPVAVRYRPMAGRPSLNMNVGFGTLELLSFEQPDRILNRFYVEQGDFVRAGDILVSARRENTEIFVQRHLREVDELARFEEDFEYQRTNRQIELEDLRYELETARDWERPSINLAIAELEYEDFVRSNERAIIDMRRQIAETEALMNDEYITSPIDGLVIFLDRFFREDWDIDDGHIMAAVADVDTMNLHVRGHLHILRYDDIVPVIFAEHEFLTRVVNDPFAAGARDIESVILEPFDSEILPRIFAEFEYDWNSFSGNPSRFAMPTWNMFGPGIWIRNEAVHHEPVRGEVGATRTFVMVYENGIFGRRIVTLSPYVMGSYVHVLSGLAPGEIVADAGAQDVPEGFEVAETAQLSEDTVLEILADFIAANFENMTDRERADIIGATQRIDADGTVVIEMILEDGSLEEIGRVTAGSYVG
ncbi:MAG: hypothetical protein FWF77_06260 [Defluviitaleaceae bacterium]|nr:hypothetical protein [Defluviitaleaceae bacterium]